jgi:ParB-like nuclease domain
MRSRPLSPAAVAAIADRAAARSTEVEAHVQAIKQQMIAKVLEQHAAPPVETCDDWRSYTLHPLCELFPAIEGAAFGELVASIKENGLQEPITVLDGTILDGRNRYNACLAAGVEPVFVPFRGDDPVRFVIAANVHRRHLDASQRAVIAAKIAVLQDGQRQVGKFADVPTQARAAEMLNVSERSVRSARQVLERATPADIKAITEGKASVSGVAKKLKAAEAEPDNHDDDNDDDVDIDDILPSKREGPVR